MRTKTRFAGYLGAALAAVMLGAIVQPAVALEISRHEAKDNPEINAILPKGKIDLGDTFDLQVYIASLPKKPSIVVYLNSPGGNLAEGMRLGRFFYQNKIETVVDSKTACTSACALAFLGGRDNGSGKPQRTKFSTAGLGFHSFSREFDNTRSYTADDFKGIVRGTQVQVFTVAEYLRSISTDLDVLRVMLRAAANQMNYLSNDDAIALNIRVWDEKRDQAVEPELVRASLDRSHMVSGGPNPTASSTTGAASSEAPRPVSKAESSAKTPS